MKNPFLWIAPVIACSTVIGVSLASNRHFVPEIVSSPTAPSPSHAASPSPQSVASSPAPSDASLQDFAHQRITLTDVVQWGSEFYQFREQLRQAVRDRNASFIKPLISEKGIAIGFGRPQLFDQLNLDNPHAQFWAVLEKSLAHGCGQDTMTQAHSAEPGWICPNITDAFYRDYPKPGNEVGIDYEMSRVIVVGNGVNVRAQPSSDSPVIATLSNEVVAFDQQTWEQLPDDQRIQFSERLNGWIPVVLPNQRRGYVANRYAYFPLGHRIVFGKVDNRWQMLQIMAGD